MNMRKVIFPLLAVFAGAVAFAQNDGYEPDWNNLDEVGNVFVCLDKENEGIQSQGEWDCLNGVWFTVDMLADGKDGLKADKAQVEILTRLFDKYKGLYKAASNVEAGKEFDVKNRWIYLYKLPSDNFKLVLEHSPDVLGSQVFFKTFGMAKSSYLIVLPNLNNDFSGRVTLRLEEGSVKADVVLQSPKASEFGLQFTDATSQEDGPAKFESLGMVVMEPCDNEDDKIWTSWIQKRVAWEMNQERSK